MYCENKNTANPKLELEWDWAETGDNKESRDGYVCKVCKGRRGVECERAPNAVEPGALVGAGASRAREGAATELLCVETVRALLRHVLHLWQRAGTARVL